MDEEDVFKICGCVVWIAILIITAIKFSTTDLIIEIILTISFGIWYFYKKKEEKKAEEQRKIEEEQRRIEEERRKIEEEKRKKEEKEKERKEWTNNLRNGEQVSIMNNKIAIKEDSIVINDSNIFKLNDVNELYIKENETGAVINSIFNGQITKKEVVSMYEYRLHRSTFDRIIYSDGSRFTYNLIKQYYLSIKFNDNVIIRRNGLGSAQAALKKRLAMLHNISITYVNEEDTIYSIGQAVEGMELEGCIKITKEDREKLEEINNLIKEKQKEGNTITNKDNNTTTKVSLTDELKNYSEQFDSGVITQEEFNAKVKELLNV